MADVKRGDEFTHRSLLDPGWKPEPGQRYADGPMAQMRVTRVTKTTVWYGYVDFPGAGAYRMDRTTFEQRYGEVLAHA